MVTAPSNAAIDEVTHRLSRMVVSGQSSRKLKVVRIGAPKSMNISVQEMSLDFLVDQRLGATNTDSKDANIALTAVQADLDSVKSQLHTKESEVIAIRDNAARRLALEDEIHKLKSRRQDLRIQVQRLHDQQR